jgi:hypothetical protein
MTPWRRTGASLAAMDEDGDEQRGDGTDEPGDGTGGTDRDAAEADEAAGAAGPEAAGRPARQPALAGAWRRWTRPRPLVALAALTVVLAAVSFLLNREQQTPDRPATRTTVRVSTSLQILPGRCAVTVPQPVGGEAADATAYARPYACDQMEPGRRTPIPRGPVSAEARAAGLRLGQAISDRLDQLGLDCRRDQERDAGCPTATYSTAAAGPSGALIVVAHVPGAVTDAQITLTQRTLVAAGYRTVTVRRPRPYDPAPPADLLWSLDTGGACVIGERSASGGGTYDVYGRLPGGTCLI